MTTTTTTTEYIDACLVENDCDVNAVCNPLESGKYVCVCSDGYRGSGKACRDINECKEDSHNCPDGTACENIDGGFNCVTTTTTTTTTTTSTTTSTTEKPKFGGLDLNIDMGDYNFETSDELEAEYQAKMEEYYNYEDYEENYVDLGYDYSDAETTISPPTTTSASYRGEEFEYDMTMFITTGAAGEPILTLPEKPLG